MPAPLIDPTANVVALVVSSVKRLDDLRESDSRHIRELLEKEAQRIDANRQKDQADVTSLAVRREDDAKVLRELVAATAATQNDRISKLEERSYKGEGRGGGMQQFWGYIVAGVTVTILIWKTFGH